LGASLSLGRHSAEARAPLGAGEEKAAGEVPEGGRLRNGRVVASVQLDEIFEAFDPVTRQAFRGWQQSLSQSVEGRGMDLNDAFGNLPTFAAGGADLLDVLDTQPQAASRLLSNTDVVFAALTRREDQLANLITNSEPTFAATRPSAAQSIQIFPTFLDESRLTLRRLQRFSVDTRPLVRDLRPVARDLRPTLRSVRLLAPDLKAFFGDLGPLITAARRGLPALRAVLRETRPTQDPDTTLPTTAPVCLTQTPPDFQGQRTKYPQVRPHDYSNSR